MKTNSLFWALSWVAVGSFAVMQGCGGDDDDDGDDGSTGGKGGSAGSGTGGKGGSAGSSTGGKGGSAGSATTGGTSGAGGAPGGAGGEGGDNVGGEGGAADPLARNQACTEYCQLYQDKDCELSTSNTYVDEPHCREVCNTADWELGTPGDAAGNSVHCRLTHAGLASATARPDETHCGHAAEVPTDLCE